MLGPVVSLIPVLINTGGCVAAVEEVGSALRKVLFQAEKWEGGRGGHL